MMETFIDKIQALSKIIEENSTEGALKQVSSNGNYRIIFSTSFSYEDQIITEMISKNHLNIDLFTLDTGRLFAETYSTWNATIDQYSTNIKAYYPNHNLLEDFVSSNGPNSFYESVEKRKNCCYIRKVEPLKRAISGYDIWVTGLRSEHSENRLNLSSIEWDEGNKIIKYHPLLNWSFESVKKYVNDNNIPYNPLHDRGFVSIGCSPCTRAIKEGEDFRAGRWWWEDSSKKECGLHEIKHEAKTY
ncbi:MAG: phosphoadenylyl-sulfate reductase [Ginsengibacter sp.]